MPYDVRITNLENTAFWPGHVSGKMVIKVLNNYYVFVRHGSGYLQFYRGTNYDTLSLVATLFTNTVRPYWISQDAAFHQTRQSIGINYSSGGKYHYFREITLANDGTPTVGSQIVVFSGSTYNRSGTGIWAPDRFWASTSYPYWVRMYHGITSFTLRWRSSKSYGYTRVDMCQTHLGNNRILIVFHGYNNNNLYFTDLDLTKIYKADAASGLYTNVGKSYLTSFQVAHHLDAGKTYLSYKKTGGTGIAEYNPSSLAWSLKTTIGVHPPAHYGLASEIDPTGILHILILDSAATAYLRYYSFDGTTVTKEADIPVPSGYGSAWSWLGRFHFSGGDGTSQLLSALARTDTGRLIIIEIPVAVFYEKVIDKSLSLPDQIAKFIHKVLLPP